MNLSQFTFVLKVFPELGNLSNFTIIIIYGILSPLALARLVGLKVRGPTGETRVIIPRAPQWSSNPSALVFHHLAFCIFYATGQSLEVTSPLCSQWQDANFCPVAYI